MRDVDKYSMRKFIQVVEETQQISFEADDPVVDQIARLHAEYENASPERQDFILHQTKAMIDELAYHYSTDYMTITRELAKTMGLVRI